LTPPNKSIFKQKVKILSFFSSSFFFAFALRELYSFDGGHGSDESVQTVLYELHIGGRKPPQSQTTVVHAPHSSNLVLVVTKRTSALHVLAKTTKKHSKKQKKKKQKRKKSIWADLRSKVEPRVPLRTIISQIVAGFRFSILNIHQTFKTKQTARFCSFHLDKMDDSRSVHDHASQSENALSLAFILHTVQLAQHLAFECFRHIKRKTHLNLYSTKQNRDQKTKQLYLAIPNIPASNS
jgi:hypothetical protein